MNRLEREVLELIESGALVVGRARSWFESFLWPEDLRWHVKGERGVQIRLYWDRMGVSDGRRGATASYSGWWARYRLDRACRQAQKRARKAEQLRIDCAVASGGIDGLLNDERA